LPDGKTDKTILANVGYARVSVSEDDCSADQKTASVTYVAFALAGPVQPTRTKVSSNVERATLNERHTLALLVPPSSADTICSTRSGLIVGAKHWHHYGATSKAIIQVGSG